MVRSWFFDLVLLGLLWQSVPNIAGLGSSSKPFYEHLILRFLTMGVVLSTALPRIGGVIFGAKNIFGPTQVWLVVPGTAFHCLPRSRSSFWLLSSRLALVGNVGSLVSPKQKNRQHCLHKPQTVRDHMGSGFRV